MTSPTALTWFAFQQAFLRLDSDTRMWTQMKAQQITSIGRFGPSEIASLKQLVIVWFGPSAMTGSPCLLEIVCWFVLKTMAQQPANATAAASFGSVITSSQQQNTDLQNSLLLQLRSLLNLQLLSQRAGSDD